MGAPQITLRSDGALHELLLDGEPLGGVVECSVVAKAGHRTTVNVVLHVTEYATALVEHPVVNIPDRTRQTLTALGWTPPAENG